MPHPSVVPLTNFGRDDIHHVGGKAANLGEMLRAGLPVPPGFVVTIAAYRAVIADDLARRLSDMAKAEGTHDQIRSLVHNAPVPTALANEIRAAYRKLADVPVAVRSSATAEDLPGATAAGQQDTYLNVIGEDAVLDAVRRCWASLWTERAIAYRRRAGIDSVGAHIAVVVQQMVAADAAGVMFTADPVTGDRDTMVVNASTGLGEAVVSGAVTADHVILHKRTGRVLRSRAGRREVELRPRAGGGVDRITPEAAGAPGRGSGTGELALPVSALRDLARLGRSVEQRFGRPQDIEWAWAEEKLWLVQARPITALPDPLPRLRGPQRLILRMVDELMPMRPYPLDVTTWSSALFISATSVPRYFGVRASTFEQICVVKNGVVVRIDPPAVRPGPKMILAPVRLVALAIRYNPARWRADPLIDDALARTREWERLDLTLMSWPDLLSTLHQAVALAPLLGELRRRYLPRALLSLIGLRLALKTLHRHADFATLLAAVPTETRHSNQALEELAAQIRRDPQLTAVFRDSDPAGIAEVLRSDPACAAFDHELRQFMDEYGHRETVALLASQPTWKDAPEIVVGLLRGLAAEPPAATGRAKAAEEALWAHPVLRRQPVRALMAGLLRRARMAQQIREDSHFYGTAPMPVIRRVLLEAGRRLAGANVIDTPSDVFHLTLEELERVVSSWPPPPGLAQELARLVHDRATARAELSHRPLLDPRYLATSHGDDHADADALVRGTPGSPGTAEGPVRIVRDPSEFGNLQPGDILIAPYTNPAWTPLFQRAAAVVVDSGSGGSHAAIVAREYGIPAVMGTGDGTQRLKANQLVRVEADRGVVLAVDRDATAADD